MMGSQRKGVQSASRLAFAVHVALFASLAVQAPVQAAEKVSSAVQQEFIAFHIPAQPLDKAVLIFAEQAGLQVLFDSQMLQGLKSLALNGDFGVQEGLARLLGGNPVEYRFTGERQVTLTRVSGEHNGALALGTTSVTASEGSSGDWVYQTPEGVSVITSEQINRRAPRHAADMLEETPGVYTAVDQRDPGLSVNIRGVQDYGRVNMNVDGMRQNFNVNGHQHRNGVMLIDPEMISSIEIDKGTQSGMGGAAVLGGIATFKTLEASDFLKDGKSSAGVSGRVAALENWATVLTSMVAGYSPSATRLAMPYLPTANGISATTAAVGKTPITWGMRSGSNKPAAKPGTTG